MPEDEVPAESLIDETSKAESRELSSLKRGREGSVDPTIPGASSSATTLTSKKNRLEPTAESNDTSPVKSTAEIDPAESSNPFKTKEAKNVKEVRRKVEKMNWKEGEGEKEAQIEETEDIEPVESGWEDIDEAEVEEAKDKATEDSQAMEVTTSSMSTTGEGLKRKALDRSESSATVNDEEKTKRPKDTPSPPALEKQNETVPPISAPSAPPKKPQTTFGSFASTASPFSTSRTSSPFASAPTTTTSQPAKSAFSSSAFGSYSSNANPFAKKAAAQSKESEDKESKVNNEATASKPGPSTFGDILKESKADIKDEEEKLHMSEKDGEEDEETMYQTRAKLYVMQGDGGWRERGVGTLKLNVRASDGKGARLVMRAEGVLRLILNVSLYVGMSCLEDGKHVRMTVFEGSERQLITFRTGSSKAATELCGYIHEHIPLESTPAPTSKSPDPVKAQSTEPDSAV